MKSEAGALSVASRLRAVDTLAAAAELDPHTVAPELLLAVAAGLKAGGFRSGWGYISALRGRVVSQGKPWSTELAQAAAEARRSLARGLGPPRRAAAVVLETLPQHLVG